RCAYPRLPCCDPFGILVDVVSAQLSSASQAIGRHPEEAKLKIPMAPPLKRLRAGGSASVPTAALDPARTPPAPVRFPAFQQSRRPYRVDVLSIRYSGSSEATSRKPGCLSPRPNGAATVSFSRNRLS